MNNQENNIYQYYKNSGGYFFRCKEIPWRVIEQWENNQWIETNIGLKGLDEISESELPPKILSNVKEIILTEKDLKKCQEHGLLTNLKSINEEVKILRGPKRLL